MPFTPAHPLAVLPLVRWSRPLRLDATSLVIGSMAPDFDYFVRGRLGGGLGHTVLGLGVWCIPVTLIVGALYHALVKWPWLLVAPAWVAARATGAIGGPWRARWGAVAVVSCMASAVIGGATHLVWDSFTHANGWAVQRFPILDTDMPFPVLGSDPVHRVLQHLSSVVGLAIVGAIVIRGLRRRSPAALPDLDRTGARWSFVVCIGTAMVLLVARVMMRRDYEAGDLVVAPISGAMAGSIVAALFVRSRATAFRARCA